MASGFSPRPHTRGSGTVLLRAATLVAATGIGILASAAYLWITPPVYEASAELLIEADDPRAGPGPADDGMVETQAALIRSQVILDPLIEIESLQTDPTFAETAHEPVLKPAIRRIKAMLGTAEPEPEASPADYDAVLKAQPNTVSALYGRGYAKLKKGDKRGQADMSTATTAAPTIAQEFKTRKGWTRQTLRKQVSAAWLRKLRREGVTHVALNSDGRTADFSIEELLASAAKGTK